LGAVGDAETVGAGATALQAEPAHCALGLAATGRSGRLFRFATAMNAAVARTRTVPAAARIGQGLRNLRVGLIACSGSCTCHSIHCRTNATLTAEPMNVIVP